VKVLHSPSRVAARMPPRRAFQAFVRDANPRDPERARCNSPTRGSGTVRRSSYFASRRAGSTIGQILLATP
jgi:hypothetical protein